MRTLLTATALCALALAAPCAVLAGDALPVQLVPVKTVTPLRDFRLSGTIEALESYSAGFRDGGRVISVSVDVGDVVHAGEEIARIDPKQAEASLRSAQAALQAAEASLVQARQARDRAQGLLERGSGTQADLDSATESYLTAKGSRDQAQAQLAAARRTEEDTVLRAVEDAVVTERSAEPGQVVSAGTAIVTLAGVSGREAVFLAPDMEDLDQALGARVSIRPVTGDSSQAVTATVSEISPVVADNGTVTTKARIDEDSARTLTIGEAVEGMLTFPLPPEITVPWTALTSTAEGPAVWVVGADNTVSLRAITISAFTDDSILVASGLKDGEVVVGQGAQGLYPGRTVAGQEVQP
ncbi:efflux RND transporter periplasmic adaptor subunit [Pseudooceanicola sp. CBS1P-1]|uniref:Efflux RND transporter periplasmic adaptor subunit n=1 Tax=Pseudooceanicola albus TaxID=2692189 RepID=A0A6L7G1T5_9RHOB|nr:MULTISPECIES: efflux RND transporter periplasmic adaptor subunit [Pseudooceanicola]MBT9384971.1 efflux RND transporter periplasmic adaptor subunit [Pseudooceanicola endophyticus]MXN18035.1 efflux RND transporter periplasmic adaptor subunit [Pseudooceanicola albus]